MIAVIIQARMGSTRLPGKVLKKVNGMTLLEYQVNRVKKAKKVDEVIIATTDSEKDNAIVELCMSRGIKCFRGSEKDVLERYYYCAKRYRADYIVRLTADCPLIDPEIVDKVIDLFLHIKVDYVANTAPPETTRYPDGSDVEIFSFNNLEKVYFNAKNPLDREHVTFYFWKYNHGFKVGQLKQEKDWSKYRITVDYPEDFEVITLIINELEKRKKFGSLSEIIDILNENKEIREINSKYYFGIGWE